MHSEEESDSGIGRVKPSIWVWVHGLDDKGGKAWAQRET